MLECFGEQPSAVKSIAYTLVGARADEARRLAYEKSSVASDKKIRLLFRTAYEASLGLKRLFSVNGKYPVGDQLRFLTFEGFTAVFFEGSTRRT